MGDSNSGSEAHKRSKSIDGLDQKTLKPKKPGEEKKEKKEKEAREQDAPSDGSTSPRDKRKGSKGGFGNLIGKLIPKTEKERENSAPISSMKKTIASGSSVNLPNLVNLESCPSPISPSYQSNSSSPAPSSLSQSPFLEGGIPKSPSSEQLADNKQKSKAGNSLSRTGSLKGEAISMKGRSLPASSSSSSPLLQPNAVASVPQLQALTSAASQSTLGRSSESEKEEPVGNQWFVPFLAETLCQDVEPTDLALKESDFASAPLSVRLKLEGIWRKLVELDKIAKQNEIDKEKEKEEFEKWKVDELIRFKRRLASYEVRIARKEKELDRRYNEVITNHPELSERLKRPTNSYAEENAHRREMRTPRQSDESHTDLLGTTNFGTLPSADQIPDPIVIIEEKEDKGEEDVMAIIQSKVLDKEQAFSKELVAEVEEGSVFLKKDEEASDRTDSSTINIQVNINDPLLVRPLGSSIVSIPSMMSEKAYFNSRKGESEEKIEKAERNEKEKEDKIENGEVKKEKRREKTEKTKSHKHERERDRDKDRDRDRERDRDKDKEKERDKEKEKEKDKDKEKDKEKEKEKEKEGSEKKGITTRSNSRAKGKSIKSLHSSSHDPGRRKSASIKSLLSGSDGSDPSSLEHLQISPLTGSSSPGTKIRNLSDEPTTPGSSTTSGGRHLGSKSSARNTSSGNLTSIIHPSLHETEGKSEFASSSPPVFSLINSGAFPRQNDQPRLPSLGTSASSTRSLSSTPVLASVSSPLPSSSPSSSSVPIPSSQTQPTISAPLSSSATLPSTSPASSTPSSQPTHQLTSPSPNSVDEEFFGTPTIPSQRTGPFPVL